MRGEFVHGEGCWALRPNDFAYFGMAAELPSWKTLVPSMISGAPGYLLRDAEVELALSGDELLRLARRDLEPGEYRALVERFGVFYLVHDDFYDEATSRALQPMTSRKAGKPVEHRAR